MLDANKNWWQMDGEWNVNGFKLLTPCLGTITEIAKWKHQLQKCLNVTVKSQSKDKMCRENKSNIITIFLLILALGILHQCMCYFIQRLLLFLLTVPRLHLLVFHPVCLPLHYSWPVFLPRLMISHRQFFFTPMDLLAFLAMHILYIQYFHHMSILSHVSCTFCSVLQSHCNHINVVSKLTYSFTNTLWQMH